MLRIVLGLVCGAVVGYVVALHRDPVKARGELGAVQEKVRGALKTAAAWAGGALTKGAAWVGRKIGL